MIFTIAARELRSLFLSPLAWAILAVVMFIFGYLFLAAVDTYLLWQPQLAMIEDAPGVSDTLTQSRIAEQQYRRQFQISAERLVVGQGKIAQRLERDVLIVSVIRLCGGRKNRFGEPRRFHESLGQLYSTDGSVLFVFLPP